MVIMNCKVALLAIMFSKDPAASLLEWSQGNCSIDAIIEGDEVDLSSLNIGEYATVAFIIKPEIIAKADLLREKKIIIQKYQRIA